MDEVKLETMKILFQKHTDNMYKYTGIDEKVWEEVLDPIYKMLRLSVGENKWEDITDILIETDAKK